MWQTYTNCTWQNDTLNAANAVARGDRGSLYDLGMRLGLDGFPEQVIHNTDAVPKSAFQHLENHDHSRFLSNFGVIKGDDPPFDRADRSKWFKVQPFLIALFAGKGIPMLWQGEELGADNCIPERGLARIGVIRPMPWELFYDQQGRNILRLCRRLTGVRRENPQFRTGSYFSTTIGPATNPRAFCCFLDPRVQDSRWSR